MLFTVILLQYMSSPKPVSIGHPAARCKIQNVCFCHKAARSIAAFHPVLFVTEFAVHETSLHFTRLSSGRGTR